MVAGVILAGGLSTRANTNKLLLEVDGRPLILHTIETLKPYVDRLIVVTGKFDEQLRPYLNDVEVVYNENYQLGMFSSVLKGVNDIDCDVVILPGDMANIAHTTIETILNTNGLIRIPTYLGKRGHPLFLSSEILPSLKKEDIDSNLKEFLNKNEDKINLIPVNDQFIKIDIDTIEDYQKFISLRKETTL